ncbi:MAG: TonB-dependent receptor [Ferruginibacter sp.]
MKYILALLFTVNIAVMAIGQSCTIKLSGKITDRYTKEALQGSVIRISTVNVNSLAQKDGSFLLSNICAGTYSITVTHINCDTIHLSIDITKDTVINFVLPHHAKDLKGVILNSEKRRDINTVAKSEMKAVELFQQAGQSLGETLKSLPGLNSIQTGPTISKPVIHGLHSNRLLILNNGIRQEGQQWGSEHAPEIDPFIATRISVIKGAASVRYGSDAIVGVILVEPKILEPTKKLQGELNIVAGTNGRAVGTSAMLEGKIKNNLFDSLNWRVQGTLKKAGNFKTADYYLKNTGATEADFSATTNFKKKNYGGEIYYSEFHNKVGIFEGSHVGNVDDLNAAFARPKPITASYFSYDIARTYQNITHNLLKVATYYDFKNGNKLEAVYSYQKNLREEYDIDLPYTTDPDILRLPQISFKIKTTNLDLIYHFKPKNNFSGSIGLTGATQSNVFKGLRYLVPNFRNYTGGVYGIERYAKGKWLFEAGARYDYRWLKTYQRNPVTVVKFSTLNIFNNLTATVGSSYKLNDKFSFSANIGSAWRAPSINELFINGIHLSAASYEKGDSTLVSERSYNFSFAARYESEKLFIELAPYNSIINGYIYAKPTLQPITLINGTFPYFKYTQQNVNLSGIDAELRYKINKHFSFDSKTTLVRGWNKSIKDHLIFMPGDRFSNSIKYETNTGHLNNLYVSIENVTESTQTRVPPNSDYVAPPKGYSIFNANAGFELPVKNKKVLVDLAATNFTNVAYRDYLNRFRYYANDLGINVVLRLKLIF